MWLRQQKFIFSQFWTLQVQDQVDFWWGLSSWLAKSYHLSIVSHGLSSMCWGGAWGGDTASLPLHICTMDTSPMGLQSGPEWLSIVHLVIGVLLFPFPPRCSETPRSYCSKNCHIVPLPILPCAQPIHPGKVPDASCANYNPCLRILALKI
jgi:hypothetical protein